jgi:hypothetical protein
LGDCGGAIEGGSQGRRKGFGGDLDFKGGLETFDNFKEEFLGRIFLEKLVFKELSFNR